MKNNKFKELYARILELKSNLRKTDYLAIKYAEGRISAEEYAAIGEQRQSWRDEINSIESEIRSMWRK